MLDIKETGLIKELISLKLNSIRMYLDEILLFWNQESLDEFITNSRTGNLLYSEIDLKTVMELMSELEEYQLLYNELC